MEARDTGLAGTDVGRTQAIGRGGGEQSGAGDVFHACVHDADEALATHDRGKRD